MEEINSMTAKPFFRDTVKPAQYMELGCPPGFGSLKGCLSRSLPPSTKAEGAPTINNSFNQMIEIVADDLSQRLRVVSLELYQKGVEIAEKRGIILTDTKF
jgi:phosphoribosylaminoimidazole-succinocarboxamide synthase